MTQRFSVALIVFLAYSFGFLGASETEAFLKSAKNDPKDVFMKAFQNYNMSTTAVSARLKGFQEAEEILSERVKALYPRRGAKTSLFVVCSMRNKCKAKIEELRKHRKLLFAHDPLVRKGQKAYRDF